MEGPLTRLGKAIYQWIEITRDVRFLENHLKTPKVLSEDFYPDEPFDAGQEDLEEVDKESRITDEQEVAIPTRRRGRPRIIRTGLPGRPRKDYGRGEVDQGELACVAEIFVMHAISGANSFEWKDAMASEVKFLIKNNTWSLVERSKDQRVIGSRFVLRNKYKSDGSIEKRKARIVARGFSQRPRINFHETFAPVARMSSIRAAVAVAAQKGMKLEQLDITTTYLNGDVEEIFMEAPEYLEDILKHIDQARREDDSVKKAARKMLEK
ncbi:copia-like retrotransposable protein [Lasius niger]|uniref:Copia-like retrotransposable protein n=1 Tax=Lasius niger TaxID=67767 RepID=A0A0J7K9P5_LASNI|nr:copia-like retrotransposable protein [Lasius niger]